MALRIKKIWFLSFFVVSACLTGQPDVYSKYASAGQIRLGDNIDKFERITGVKPVFCAHCKEGERFADIGASDYRSGLIGEGFEFLFRDNRLVLIVIGPTSDSFEEISAIYEKRLNKKAVIKRINSTNSSARWVVNGVVLNITFNNETKKVTRIVWHPV